MPGKRDSMDASKRPLAQKLSNFMHRRSSTKRDKAQETTGERRSIFRLKRQEQPAASKSALVFKPLEVDLDNLGTSRLSDGWLQRTTPNQSRSRQDREHRPSELPSRSKTPIADLFASTSRLDLSIATERRQSRAQAGDHAHKDEERPFSRVEAHSVLHHRALAHEALTRAASPDIHDSILNRGRPVEARHSVVDFPTKPQESLRPIQLEHDTVPIKRASSIRESRPLQPSYHSVRSASVSKTLKSPSQNATLETVGRLERDSKYEGVIRLSDPPVVKTTPALAPRSASATPSDRIQAWQKSIAPKTTPTASSPSPAIVIPAKSSRRKSTVAPASPFTAGPAAPPQTQVRKVSPRGLTNDRLAWIKELEDKKLHGVNQELGSLKRQQTGSVSTKLALFENKQTLGTTPATLRLPPLSRSNSTTSRFSAAGMDSTFSANSNVGTSTPRTSLDTVRSSKRASSVMSYYDDSFREKMETLVASDNYTPAVEKPEIPNKQRVSMRFIPVEPTKAVEAPPPEETPLDV